MVRVAKIQFIPAGNKPSGMPNIWRLPRGSKTPLLAAGSLIVYGIVCECRTDTNLGAVALINQCAASFLCKKIARPRKNLAVDKKSVLV